jgi:hypothetical protein
MRNSIFLSSLILIGAALIGGCKPADQAARNVPADEPQDVKTVAVVLCGKCGHEKGSESCCSDDCEVCDQCKLHKGSALCCKVSEELRGKDMCTACGHVANGEECCKDGCAVCSKCGMHEGSPLCCKLNVDSEATTDDTSN